MNWIDAPTCRRPLQEIGEIGLSPSARTYAFSGEEPCRPLPLSPPGSSTLRCPGGRFRDATWSVRAMIARLEAEAMDVRPTLDRQSLSHGETRLLDAAQAS